MEKADISLEVAQTDFSIFGFLVLLLCGEWKIQVADFLRFEPKVSGTFS